MFCLAAASDVYQIKQNFASVGPVGDLQKWLVWNLDAPKLALFFDIGPTNSSEDFFGRYDACACVVFFVLKIFKRTEAGMSTSHEVLSESLVKIE